MKKNLILMLIICLCVFLSVCFTSCDIQGENEDNTNTEPIELKEFADPEALSKIKGGMSQKDVNELLKAYPTDFYTNLYEYKIYKFSDGRVAYIIFNTNDAVSSIDVCKAIDPALVDGIRTGYPFDRITEMLGTDGILINSAPYGTYAFPMLDGRTLILNCQTDMRYGQSYYVVESFEIE